ncbi:hypothetical protein GDO81_029753 [Engystomops pustulosus]|uniref:Uncharacterized protein n=1 Tax=Engystomops pustulosus TaxID=76066 RepID=A0AAV6YD84_ENGPU|nr:hypothetical protein GDO81_029753 [Engystomops pustulosus]KAG8534991.1 hypothetical protein GDO81_029753 [Engystomops pustulosus]
MSERPEDDVRAEPRRAGARHTRHSTAALPSPGAMLGQPWGHWLEATGRLHDEPDESYKEGDKKREAMRLSKEGE